VLQPASDPCGNSEEMSAPRKADGTTSQLGALRLSRPAQSVVNRHAGSNTPNPILS